MKKHFLFLFLFGLLSSHHLFSATLHVGDSIIATKVLQTPTIDGFGTDAVWQGASWNSMPYMWQPYGVSISASDFTGRFKIVWNESTNLLYFLFEITDDFFFTGYIPAVGDGSYSSHDCVELFLDENRSGGIHALDNNAFAYHITGGNASSEYNAMDIWDPTGTWSSNIHWGSNYIDYNSHFPEYKRTKSGTKYTWEFSTMLIKDTYTSPNDPALSKALLTGGKIIGMSAAYCDNDADDSNRDNFISSKYLESSVADNSWIDASYFGYLELGDSLGKKFQFIIFNSISSKKITDPPFILSAIGGQSENSIVFTSSNPSVAKIDGSTVTIVGTGITEIIASQAGNNIYGSATSKQTLTVTAAGSNFELNNATVSVFPNPSTGIVNITIKDGTDLPELIISDITGTIVLKKSMLSTNESFDLSSSSKGMYIVQMAFKNKSIERKIVIQ